MSIAAFPLPTISVTNFDRAWWVIDPRDRYACCPDCQQLATTSPYIAPGSASKGDGNELWQTPGDGATVCGGDCTCVLSYVPPHLLLWPPFDQLSAQEKRVRMKVKATKRRMRALDRARAEERALAPTDTSQPAIRRYDDEAACAIDSQRMVRVGWRLVALSHKSSGIVIAKYEYRGV